jgi:hypothetical protein
MRMCWGCVCEFSFRFSCITPHSARLVQAPHAGPGGHGEEWRIQPGQVLNPTGIGGFEAGPGGGHEVGEATQFTPVNVWTDVEEGCKACGRFKGEESPGSTHWVSGPLVHSEGTTGPVGRCTRLCHACYEAWSVDGQPPLWLGKAFRSINDEPGFQRAVVGVPGGVVSGAGVGEKKLGDAEERKRERRREQDRLHKRNARAKAKEGRAGKGEGGGGEKA